MAETFQKTWRELLGEPDIDCSVDGRYIIRKTGAAVRVLWSFDTHREAVMAYHTWVSEKQGV